MSIYTRPQPPVTPKQRLSSGNRQRVRNVARVKVDRIYHRNDKMIATLMVTLILAFMLLLSLPAHAQPALPALPPLPGSSDAGVAPPAPPKITPEDEKKASAPKIPKLNAPQQGQNTLKLPDLEEVVIDDKIIPDAATLGAPTPDATSAGNNVALSVEQSDVLPPLVDPSNVSPPKVPDAEKALDAAVKPTDAASQGASEFPDLPSINPPPSVPTLPAIAGVPAPSSPPLNAADSANSPSDDAKKEAATKTTSDTKAKSPPVKNTAYKPRYPQSPYPSVQYNMPLAFTDNGIHNRHLPTRLSYSDIDRSVIYAIYHQNIGALEAMKAQGLAIEAPVGNTGQDILTLAVRMQKPRIVEWALNQGANLNNPDSSGLTAQDYAMQTRNQAIIDVLQRGGSSRVSSSSHTPSQTMTYPAEPSSEVPYRK